MTYFGVYEIKFDVRNSPGLSPLASTHGSIFSKLKYCLYLFGEARRYEESSMVFCFKAIEAIFTKPLNLLKIAGMKGSKINLSSLINLNSFGGAQ